MASKIDKEPASQAYEDVRNDNSDTTWALLGYDEKLIHVVKTGTVYDDLLAEFNDDERLFAFVRLITGDEMSKRAKFALITWCGSNVSGMKKANLTVDKSLVKEIFFSYAVDIFTSDKNEITESKLRSAVEKAGGANYGSAK